MAGWCKIGLAIKAADDGWDGHPQVAMQLYTNPNNPVIFTRTQTGPEEEFRSLIIFTV